MKKAWARVFAVLLLVAYLLSACTSEKIPPLSTEQLQEIAQEYNRSLLSDTRFAEALPIEEGVLYFAAVNHLATPEDSEYDAYITEYNEASMPVYALPCEMVDAFLLQRFMALDYSQEMRYVRKENGHYYVTAGGVGETPQELSIRDVCYKNRSVTFVCDSTDGALSQIFTLVYNDSNWMIQSVL